VARTNRLFCSQACRFRAYRERQAPARALCCSFIAGLDWRLGDLDHRVAYADLVLTRL
jgi:hypothetical protein